MQITQQNIRTTRREKLVELLEGAKVGALNGLPWGAFSAAVFILHDLYYNPFSTPSIFFQQFFFFSIGFISVLGAGLGSVCGVVLAVIFTKVRNRLPTRSLTLKAVVFYIVFWLAFQAIVNPWFYWPYMISYLRYPRIETALWLAEFWVLSLLIALGSAITFSYLFRRTT